MEVVPGPGCPVESSPDYPETLPCPDSAIRPRACLCRCSISGDPIPKIPSLLTLLTPAGLNETSWAGPCCLFDNARFGAGVSTRSRGKAAEVLLELSKG